ncbi:hypothetical protein Dsin_024357 [Dipteronia sinensis]|uniref:Uncharacterized protein n=1 Tax=Dipteronia sinensis TaxID=43782 RepID=A0AAD9ZUA9_9ROSI|nr:hypothetical protein Dsin_024357 [Dipteronia sinensis]
MTMMMMMWREKFLDRLEEQGFQKGFSLLFFLASLALVLWASFGVLLACVLLLWVWNSQRCYGIPNSVRKFLTWFGIPSTVRKFRTGFRNPNSVRNFLTALRIPNHVMNFLTEFGIPNPVRNSKLVQSKGPYVFGFIPVFRSVVTHNEVLVFTTEFSHKNIWTSSSFTTSNGAKTSGELNKNFILMDDSFRLTLTRQDMMSCNDSYEISLETEITFDFPQ